MKTIKIALLGLGNVGQGVWNILNTNQKEIFINCGYKIEISHILVRDINKKRDVEVPKEVLTTDFDKILNDPEVSVIVELIGGERPAIDYMLKAMEKGKHVVTANKLAIATNWGKLFDASEKYKVHFYYEASVAGGIPIIREITESLTANRIESITGIINGTTNYILTKMAENHLDYKAALKEAQEKGYAEADPSSDVDGLDAAYKLAIMASISFGTKVDYKNIYTEGIRNITQRDIHYAKKFGYAIKLLAIARENKDALELRVHPTLIPLTHPLAKVSDCFNSVFIKGNAVGDLMFYGRGAGSLPTASAVVGDIISIIRNNADLSEVMQLRKSLPIKKIQLKNENKSGYYIRLNVKDEPGVLAQITKILGDNEISIRSVTQKELNNQEASLVFITHPGREGCMQQSLDRISELSRVNKIESLIRIEDL